MNQRRKATGAGVITALRFYEFGGPEVRRVEDVERPRTGDVPALLRIAVTSISYADTMLRIGTYFFTPGFEVARTIKGGVL